MDLKIALLAGDGIGPEVIKQAVKVCNAIAQKFNHNIQWDEGLIGAAAIDETGDPYPDERYSRNMFILRCNFIWRYRRS